MDEAIGMEHVILYTPSYALLEVLFVPKVGLAPKSTRGYHESLAAAAGLHPVLRPLSHVGDCFLKVSRSDCQKPMKN